ncbi:hypothetical protein JDV02_004698 [Purpureocillium takamizusanense]|uniref:ATP-grasp domain-containing protein n=1 Tax=Purpureocillium takamizusanense TaxID=2060973 RepID=A0A9Q8QCZ7_9HYPO|nr:uncharacterized protein JDV02_004698 [Purpureocillium takamizusanense]UNI18429.1 hypothetical protein JDV02_004698 [Purpureocillium takamizusanense]
MGDTNISSLHIAVIAEQRSTYLNVGYTSEECAALPHDGELNAVAAAIGDLGHNVTLVPGLHSLVEHLAAGTHKDWDLAFNLSQGFHGSAREAHVPALLEAYQIPYTFSDAATMALCQNKGHTKMILDYYGISNAPFMLIPAGQLSPPGHTTLPRPCPLFVKPATEGSSKGIDGFNKVDNYEELLLAVQKLRTRYPGQDILVESFLSGREFTISILGTGTSSQVIGVREHIWQTPLPNEDKHMAKQEYASWKSKSSENCLLQYHDSHDMDDPLIKAACQVALDAWNALNCRDAGRVDIRFNSNELDPTPNVIEVSVAMSPVPDA